MELEPEIARVIVKSLKDIINHEINLFDTSGTIIASTDESRIGTSHDGALVAARTKEPLAIDHDDQFEGAKQGINMPVLFNNSVVAIIGITGERQEVEPFANIIRKMTEILIRENWIQITNFNQRMNYSNLVSMLIAKKRDETLTAYLSSVLDINLNLERAVVVGEFVHGASQQNINYEELSHLIYNRIVHFPDSFFAVTSQRVHMMIEKADEKSLRDFLNALNRDIQLRFKQEFVFGVGNFVKTAEELWRSYEEAQTVVNWSVFKGTSVVKNFNELDIELLFASISKENATTFIHRVFGTLSEKKIVEFAEIMNAYTKYNGSITQGAEELFIHKNTFQNKLNRMHELTGYNPRNMADYVILSTAFSLRDHLEGTAKS